VPGAKRTVRRIIVTEFLACQPKLLVLGLGALLFILISIAKYFSGPDFVFSAIYLIPIVFMTWCLSVSAGLALAVASTLVLFFINISEPHKYPHLVIPYWNAAMDFGVFLIVVFILAEAKHLYQRERELSREDFLTGLLNSRAFAEELKAEITRVRRYQHQITIVYLDLDNFKLVNDRYGHHAGDVLLSAVGNVLRSSVREVDVVARLGGDEFALLLPETEAQAAHLVMDKVETALHQLVATPEFDYPVGFSAGAVTFTKPLDSIDSMLGHADRVMYSVKQNGKGRFEHEVVA
jgi:diguanylate cyclase (GGDEF)-like protein